MNAPTKICVARHGETDWNSAGILQGWIDVPLNDLGRRQARELSESLRGFCFSRICTSPLRRAAETAEIIAAGLDLEPPLRHEGLRERNFGIIQGRPKAELAATHPHLLREILKRNPACHFEQGESLDHFADRVLEAIRDIAGRNPGGRVLVITHGWVMDVVTRHIGNLPRSAVLDMKRRNGEWLWVEVVGGTTIAETDSA
jgi:2,3-bisphosphoglycerate-dependent phosphoglycerate mutase